jgi:hypothetical protein
MGSTVVVNGSVEDHVRELKAKTGKEIGIHGSIDLARSLIDSALVDDYGVGRGCHGCGPSKAVVRRRKRVAQARSGRCARHER